jgi:outer membrane receptor protein involved in Fe transport
MLPFAGTAIAQDATEQADASQSQAEQAPADATDLDRVIVTGSLIPQSQVETFTPVTIITAEDIKARGYTSIADVVQQSSFATGGVQGSQSSASFTQGAETMSMFGLPPGFTKYLIDGRPMVDYPALYNGSDAFNNVSGIPIDLIERVEILPGGQSSLYGSDAIAGVVNFILKKKLDHPVVSVRGGWYSDGGGQSERVSAATSFSAADDRINVLIGGQYENRDAIWAYDRDITKQFYEDGATPPLASRDWLVVSPFTSYKFLDPNNCANVSSAFGGTEGVQTRPGFGEENYCGSMYTPGYRTLLNEKEATQAYAHATIDLTDNHQAYADLLLSHEEVKYHIGSNFTWWGTSVEWGYYWDPRVGNDIAAAYGEYFCGTDADCIAALPPGSLLNIQRAFAPEDMGGFENSMNRDVSDASSVTLGLRGLIGGSEWEYDAMLSINSYTLNEYGFARLAGPINAYFQEHVLGPQLGVDPLFGAYPIFEPDYEAFYTLMSPEDFNSFTDYTRSRSRTRDDMARVQVTNGALFELPGGNAGLAVALEGGKQSWRYTPDPRLLNGEIWGTTATDGAGERNRYAAVAELRLPVFDPLTVSLSTRHDNFSPEGIDSVSKTTYSIGLEYRPLETLLLRGKYGTAFKAPTLADSFQAPSGFYSTVTDYYNCQLLGFDPSDADECPAVFSNRQYFGTTQGSPDLEPLTADVWSAGFVWAPIEGLSLTADYHSWDIENDINTQNANGLALREMYCRTGQNGYEIDSPICQDALSKITRDELGRITEILTPKVNEARTKLEVVTASFNYQFDAGNIGSFLVRSSYTNTLTHEFTAFPGDEPVDFLRRPDFSSDPKSKANASITWSKGNWGATLYANRMGHVPNYAAQVGDGTYEDEDTGKLKPFTLYNASVDYRPIPSLSLSLMVNNLFNDMPPEDHTFLGSSGEPFDSSQYNAFGRAMYVEARYEFGRK